MRIMLPWLFGDDVCRGHCARTGREGAAGYRREHGRLMIHRARRGQDGPDIQERCRLPLTVKMQTRLSSLGEGQEWSDGKRNPGSRRPGKPGVPLRPNRQPRSSAKEDKCPLIMNLKAGYPI